MLRTVSAIEGDGGAISEQQARQKNRMLQVRDQVVELAAQQGLKVSPSVQASLLPTPTWFDYNTVAKSELDADDPKHRLKVAVEVLARDALLPTPNTMDNLPARDESKIDRSKGGFSNVRETVVRPGFGKFEPAIRRWEKITGMPAPEPTKPDGKDGSHRLSSLFTEWMMGLEPGWITGVGLSRKDELRACGNGVVPQQAKLALTILLDRVRGRIE